MRAAGRAVSAAPGESKWRLLVGAAPLAGAAYVVWAAAQGEFDSARWSTLSALLACVAAIGAGVAWWTARQLRPSGGMTVARATRLALAGRLAGPVALRGRARALPEAVPLVSPDGELCVWYEHRVAGDGAVQASARPFLFVDERGGGCVVLVAGAEFIGTSPCAAGAGAGAGSGERLLRAGDRVVVTGRLVAASAESAALQVAAAALVTRNEALPRALRSGESLSQDLRSAALSGAHFATAPPRMQADLALPALAGPGETHPVQVRIGPEDGEGAVFHLLALADGLVLLVVVTLVLVSSHGLA